MVCLRLTPQFEGVSSIQDTAAQLYYNFVSQICLCISELFGFFPLAIWVEAFLFSKLLHPRWVKHKLCLFWKFFTLPLCFLPCEISYFQCSNFLCCVCRGVRVLLLSLFPSFSLRFSSMHFLFPWLCHSRKWHNIVLFIKHLRCMESSSFQTLMYCTYCKSCSRVDCKSLQLVL